MKKEPRIIVRNSSFKTTWIYLVIVLLWKSSHSTISSFPINRLSHFAECVYTHICSIYKNIMFVLWVSINTWYFISLVFFSQLSSKYLNSVLFCDNRIFNPFGIFLSCPSLEHSSLYTQIFSSYSFAKNSQLWDSQLSSFRHYCLAGRLLRVARQL